MKRFKSWCCVVIAMTFIIIGANGSLLAAETEIEIGVELFVNPGFEASQGIEPVRWRVLGSGDGADLDPIDTCAVQVTSEAARTGNYGIKAELDGTGSYLISQGMLIQGGKMYEVSAWVKSGFEPGSDGRVGFKFEFIDADKKLIGPEAGGELHQYWKASYDDWEHLKWQIKAPSNAATTNVILRMYGPGWVYFDDASLKRIE